MTAPQTPLYRIGILGGGQLARMSMQVASRMGIPAISLDEDPDSPAAQVGPAMIGSIHSPDAIAEMMRVCEWITLENEFIRAETLEAACQAAGFDPERVIPGIETLRTIQDKLKQRRCYLNSGVPSPIAIEATDLISSLAKGAEADISLPAVAKAKYGGYDGKGTLFLNSPADLESAFQTRNPEEWLVEERVNFVRELAVMVVRRNEKEFAFPAMVTVQRNYVCDLVYPFEQTKIAAEAQRVAISAVRALGGEGLFGVELFETETGQILVNEIAPRPHNSGHYTMDWGGTSQFEAHLCSVLDWTSGKQVDGIQIGRPTCMANILGIDSPESSHAYLNAAQQVSQHPNARFHWYGKRASKNGRKMGHINVVSNSDRQSVAELRDAAIEIRREFFENWSIEN